MPSLSFEPEPIPLRRDEYGVVRVSGSRIPLERIVWAVTHDETPESIVRGYPSLRLADVYSIIAYYLRHRSEVDAYMEEREAIAGAVRSEIEADPRVRQFRKRLRERRDSSASPPV